MKFNTMAKFGRNANPKMKKSVLRAQIARLKPTEDKTLKEVKKDYIDNMWPADRELLFPSKKKA